MDNIRKILQFAMRMEKQGENFYRYYAGRINDAGTGKLFEQLADMEREHYNILKERFDALGGDESIQVISWVVDAKNYMKSPKIFADEAMAVDTADEDERISDLAIVRMAYLIEKDFAHFYDYAAARVDDGEAGKFLKTLAEWETGHMEIFHNRYQSLMSKNWEDIGSYLFR
ncbi:MAG: ferritin family protein [Clostridia bacterium]